jgi:hypothetical protein
MSQKKNLYCFRSGRLVMRKSSKKPLEADPQRGDAILKRMLQSKPKPHKELMEERRRGEPKGRPWRVPHD